MGALTACRSSAAQHDEPESLAYRVRIDASLTRMDVELCFEGAAPAALRPGKDEGAERIDHARWQRPGAIRRLAVASGRIRLAGSPKDGCLAYGVKLSEGGALGSAVRRVGRDLIASPNVWLWRPERITERTRATLRFELPDGRKVLVPWPERDGVHRLDASAFRFDSYAAFGHFERRSAEHRGVAVELALLDGPLAIDGDGALRWFRAALDVLAQGGAPLPARRITGLIVPVAAGGDPVSFGMVARGGEPSLLLLVSAFADERELTRDWVVPHELSHLLMPFIEREHAWLSEGLATYYQEMLRGRAGIFDERTVWSRVGGYMRDAAARDATGSLISESARMHETGSYRRVYWGGAAFWLARDIEVRRASGGVHTLDRLFAALRSEGEMREAWTARTLMDRLDALSGTDAFTRGFAAAGVEPFPDFEAALEQLGVRKSEQGVELDDAAPLAGIRRALCMPTAPRDAR